MRYALKIQNMKKNLNTRNKINRLELLLLRNEYLCYSVIIIEKHANSYNSLAQMITVRITNVYLYARR